MGAEFVASEWFLNSGKDEKAHSLAMGDSVVLGMFGVSKRRSYRTGCQCLAAGFRGSASGL